MPKRSASRLQSPLSGRLALVTGANRGIGLAIARALAREGCNLIITGRDERALARTRAELEKLRVDVLAQPCDVRSPESVGDLFERVRALHQPLDILINNAGIAHPNRTVADLPYPTWMEVIDTNLNGLFLMTQAALAAMKRGGTIVNNLSVAAERIFVGSSAYNASKHGALGFTDTLREELRPKGIRVIALLPGATDTEIWQTLWPKAPRRKMMTAESVAQIVIDALRLPANTTVEKIIIRPSLGTLEN
jgi:NAD(P)-dependent dehydrogenase (short-subunit alcohol dehydrogenase family)